VIDVIHINTKLGTKSWWNKQRFVYYRKHVSHNVQNVGSNHIYNFTQENTRK